MFVTMMMVFNVCVNDSAASLFKHSVFVEQLLVMSFDWSLLSLLWWLVIVSSLLQWYTTEINTSMHW